MSLQIAITATFRAKYGVRTVADQTPGSMTFVQDLQDFLFRWHVYKLYRTCTYIHLPEDVPSGSKRVEHIVNIKILL